MLAIITAAASIASRHRVTLLEISRHQSGRLDLILLLHAHLSHSGKHTGGDGAAHNSDCRGPQINISVQPRQTGMPLAHAAHTCWSVAAAVRRRRTPESSWGWLLQTKCERFRLQPRDYLAAHHLLPSTLGLLMVVLFLTSASSKELKPPRRLGSNCRKTRKKAC